MQILDGVKWFFALALFEEGFSNYSQMQNTSKHLKANLFKASP